MGAQGAVAAGKSDEAELLQSGMSKPVEGETAAARAGYVPVPLEQVLVAALRGMPVYLHTSTSVKRFTLYSGKDHPFTERHRERLQQAGVRFIYVAIDNYPTFQRQVETELESIVDNPALSITTRSALVYETSLELINEVLSEQGIAKNMPRVQQMARSVSRLVVNDGKAFAHLFATAQHDFYTATHMVNVGTWMTSLACAMGVTDTAQLGMICTAGMLHDVGKIFVPEEVLNKVGALQDSEWAQLRDHPRRGAEHLKSQGVTDEIVLRVTLEHHERCDGSGYPHRLGHDAMHRMSHICAVVDSFDAMTACRPFKNRVKTIAEAVQVLRAEAGSKYDIGVVEAWVGLLQRASDDGMLSEPVVAFNGLGRRTQERFAIACNAVVSALDQHNNQWLEGPPIAAKSHNISRSGAALLTEKPVAVSSYVRVCLKGGGTLENRIIEGQVVRCRAYKDGWHEVAIRQCTPGLQERASAQVMKK
jgi:HD-GYP domain-containing protein (c-di-GMP phosphodiesterase class II)